VFRNLEQKSLKYSLDNMPCLFGSQWFWSISFLFKYVPLPFGSICVHNLYHTMADNYVPTDKNSCQIFNPPHVSVG
jgi:hypothetical protein